MLYVNTYKGNIETEIEEKDFEQLNNVNTYKGNIETIMDREYRIKSLDVNTYKGNIETGIIMTTLKTFLETSIPIKEILKLLKNAISNVDELTSIPIKEILKQ